MSVNGDTPSSNGNSDASRTVDSGLMVAARTVARQLAKGGKRRIGFLPVPFKGTGPVPLGPIVGEVAAALTSFVAADVALIPAWSTWTADPSSALGPGGPPRMRIREIAPRLVEVMPPRCENASDAGQALTRALDILPEDYVHIVIDLSGYAVEGQVPGLEPIDGVVMAVVPKKTRIGSVRALDRQIPDEKALGAVLVG
jgi:hypothetical protein